MFEIIKVIFLFALTSCSSSVEKNQVEITQSDVEKIKSIKQETKVTVDLFDLVGCQHLGKLNFNDKSQKLLEKKVYFEVKKLKGNTLNGVKVQKRDENPSGETIFEIGEKVHYFSADLYRC